MATPEREPTDEEVNMKTFLAIFIGTPSAMEAWRSLPEQELKERQTRGIKAWHEWVDRNKASIVDIGAPLGRTKSVSKAAIDDIRNNMGAYTIVRSESHEAAAKLFENHPHFTIFPGQSVEIMECLPIPNA
jgi:hypothetical protein